MAEIVGYTRDELAWALAQVDSALAEGEAISVQLCTKQLPSQQNLDSLYNNMVSAGHHVSAPVATVSGDVAVTSFTMHKGSPAFAAVVSLIPVQIFSNLLTFGITALNSMSSALLLLLGGVGALALITLALNKPAQAAGGAYQEKLSPALDMFTREPRQLILEDEAQQIHELYRQETGVRNVEPPFNTAALNKIAKRTGHALSTIWRVLRRGPRGALAKPITPERLREVELRSFGLTYEQIGKELGFTKTYARYLMRLAQAKRNPAREANNWNNELLNVAADLEPPATWTKVDQAARLVKDVGAEVAMFMETAPQLDEALKFQLQDIHGRAIWGEELLNNALWCLQTAGMMYFPQWRLPPELAGRPREQELAIVTPTTRKHLESCAEYSQREAREILLGQPSWPPAPREYFAAHNEPHPCQWEETKSEGKKRIKIICDKPGKRYLLPGSSLLESEKRLPLMEEIYLCDFHRLLLTRRLNAGIRWDGTSKIWLNQPDGPKKLSPQTEPAFNLEAAAISGITGLKFEGMQEVPGKPSVMVFTDPVTRSTLFAADLATAKKSLTDMRSRFGAPAPEFKDEPHQFSPQNVIRRVCEQCGQTQNHPSVLWKIATYRGQGVKIVCPSCAFYLEQHPEKGELIGHQTTYLNQPEKPEEFSPDVEVSA